MWLDDPTKDVGLPILLSLLHCALLQASQSALSFIVCEGPSGRSTSDNRKHNRAKKKPTTRRSCRKNISHRVWMWMMDIDTSFSGFYFAFFRRFSSQLFAREASGPPETQREDCWCASISRHSDDDALRITSTTRALLPAFASLGQICIAFCARQRDLLIKRDAASELGRATRQVNSWNLHLMHKVARHFCRADAFSLFSPTRGVKIVAKKNLPTMV